MIYVTNQDPINPQLYSSKDKQPISGVFGTVVGATNFQSVCVELLRIPDCFKPNGLYDIFTKCTHAVKQTADADSETIVEIQLTIDFQRTPKTKLYTENHVFHLKRLSHQSDMQGVLATLLLGYDSQLNNDRAEISRLRSKNMILESELMAERSRHKTCHTFTEEAAKTKTTNFTTHAEAQNIFATFFGAPRTTPTPSPYPTHPSTETLPQTQQSPHPTSPSTETPPQTKQSPFSFNPSTGSLPGNTNSLAPSFSLADVPGSPGSPSFTMGSSGGSKKTLRLARKSTELFETK